MRRGSSAASASAVLARAIFQHPTVRPDDRTSTRLDEGVSQRFPGRAVLLRAGAPRRVCGAGGGQCLDVGGYVFARSWGREDDRSSRAYNLSMPLPDPPLAPPRDCRAFSQQTRIRRSLSQNGLPYAKPGPSHTSSRSGGSSVEEFNHTAEGLSLSIFPRIFL